MDIAGLYRINGEVFILPLEGGGSFTTKMSSVKVTGQSLIYSVINPEGRKVEAVDTLLRYLLSNLLLQLLQVSNFNVDFGIGHVFIQLNNLFNGENKLLADTVNKFLNDHSQEVIKEVGVFEENGFTVLHEKVISFNNNVNVNETVNA